MNPVQSRLNGLSGKGRFQYFDLLSRDLDGTGSTGILKQTIATLPIDPGQVFQIQQIGPAGTEKRISIQELLNSTKVLCDGLRATPGKVQMGVIAIGLTINNFCWIDQDVSRSRI